MGIKRYVFFAIILIALCGLYVFTFQDGSYSIEFFGVPVLLKIAVWVILPMVLLAVFSVLHLTYYYIKISFQRRALAKDYELFLESAKAALLGKDFTPKFKTPWFQTPNDMLKAIRSAKDGAKLLQDEELRKICEDISSIENKEHINIKSYKLDNENPLAIQNKLNELNQEPKTAQEILRNCTSLDSDLCKSAYDSLIKSGSYTEIRKYNFPLSPREVSAILKRNIDKEDDLYISETDIDNLINEVKMNEDEYVQIANLLKKETNPETLVAMFEKIFHKDNTAGKAYIYILFELQMIDKAREVLQNSEEEEYKEFKTYLFLRDNGQNTDLKLLVN